MVAGKGAGDELRRRRGLGLHGSGEPEGIGRGEDVQEDRDLTLSMLGCSSVMREGCNGGDGARWSSDGGGGDEEEGVDPELPCPIAGARKKREARRSLRCSSICSWWPESMAACGGARVSPRPWRGASRVSCRGEKGGGEGEQVEGVLLYPPRGARERGGGRGGHGRTAAMAPVFPLAPQ